VQNRDQDKQLATFNRGGTMDPYHYQ